MSTKKYKTEKSNFKHTVDKYGNVNFYNRSYKNSEATLLPINPYDYIPAKYKNDLWLVVYTGNGSLESFKIPATESVVAENSEWIDCKTFSGRRFLCIQEDLIC